MSGAYAKEIRDADSPLALQAVLRKWDVPDALAQAPNDASWSEFRMGLDMESRGEFAGDEWAERFGCILIPERLLRLTLARIEGPS